MALDAGWFTCKKCNYIWETTPDTILKPKKCPQCSNTYGEEKVRQYLDGYKISNIFQHKFENCRDKYPLPFDFYLPNEKVCIEYDGEQHYHPVSFGGTSKSQEIYDKTLKHDKIKNEYCKSHNIRLIRIPYWDYKNIDKILNEELKIHTKEAI